jgi:antitoxin HicB
MEAAMAPAEYLKKPYGRYVVPESDGTFRAEIIEFPGCIAVGDTAAEALASLEDVAASWLEATIARGQHVPEPIENTAFSGKLVVRLPKSLHKKAVFWAAQDGVSLNQFIVSSIAQQVGSSKAHSAASQHLMGWQMVAVDSSLIFGNTGIESHFQQFYSSSPSGDARQAVTLKNSGLAVQLPVMLRERTHA